MTTTVHTAFDEAAHAARQDMVRDILSGMKGRTFGLDYTTIDGRKRRMLAQVDSLHAEHAIVREVNLTQRKRRQTFAGLQAVGFTTPLTDTEKRTLVEYRTIRFDGVNEIRVAHQRYNIDAVFNGVIS